MFHILIASMAMVISHQNGVANIAPGSLHMASNTVIDKIAFGDESAEGKHGLVSDNSVARPAEMLRTYKYEGMALATDGETLPIAEGPLGGKGDFYR